MNRSIIRYILGYVLKIEAAFMLLPCLTALFYREKTGVFFVISALLCLVFGVLLSFKKPKNTIFYAKEGFLSVSLSWIILSIFGAIPFYISQEIPSFIDAVFESISGITTTGSSILPDVEVLSHCMLFWRSFLHWLGGMGVLVFVLAVLPMSGGYQLYLMKAESPGPSVEKLVPKMKNTAMILYGIYTVMTIFAIGLLFLFGMPLFDSICLAMGAAGTGGFGIKSDSIASYAPHLQVMITIFMILFGINFNVYYLLLCGKLKQALKSEEVRVYLGVIAVSIAMITFNIHRMYPTVREAARYAAFHVGAIITTTGYATTDYNTWPEFSKTILVILTFVGACAGSTGGGMKISRLLIMLKTVRKELFAFAHPHGIKKIKMDGRPIVHDTVRSTNVFLVSYMFILAVSLLIVSLDNHGFTTNFTAVVTTLNNVGPGLDEVGPAGNFQFYSVLSKLILCFDMLVGRLEIFPMLVLFAPSTWKRR